MVEHMNHWAAIRKQRIRALAAFILSKPEATNAEMESYARIEWGLAGKTAKIMVEDARTLAPQLKNIEEREEKENQAAAEQAAAEADAVLQASETEPETEHDPDANR